MIRFVLIALLLASPTHAAERASIPATELVAAALTALQARASAEGIVATFTPVGRVAVLTTPGSADLKLSVEPLPKAWLRQRIGVRVRASSGDRSTSATVWFQASAPSQGLVFAADYPRGTRALDLQLTTGAIDLATLHGKSPAQSPSVMEQSLRHPVRSGAPVLVEDFEPTPTVSVQQQVRVDVNTGMVRLSTAGRALTDGNVGQTISVLPANASQPVRARVVSNQVVTVEH